MDDVTMHTSFRSQSDERGSSVVEIALMMPWIFLLFLLVFDFGFYSYAAIATENAARVAALTTAFSQAAATSQTTACIAAREELRVMPNSGQFLSGAGASCTALPLIVSVPATLQAAPDDPSAFTSRVSVTYQTIPLFPIPGLMMGQLTITRVADFKVYGQ
jgi:Flp pilus assembly protein TadG